ncbi:hypothetical protein DP116_18185 [Brasilonema bromeliae SPC951]|uniref:Uncharacterized protein n=1 Tax=Brasilonema bromeliae SPC951 TaxID=385972 RepID=A0ABX1PBD9_9CYAN|nr:hypothetical protein [Brasilonema bromeliae SPC951]
MKQTIYIVTGNTEIGDSSPTPLSQRVVVVIGRGGGLTRKNLAALMQRVPVCTDESTNSYVARFLGDNASGGTLYRPKIHLITSLRVGEKLLFVLAKSVASAVISSNNCSFVLFNCENFSLIVRVTRFKSTNLLNTYILPT